MTSHGACTSGTSRVLAVESLQRLKMEALIPALADGVVSLWYYLFGCTEHSADRNSSRSTRIRRVESSNFDSDQSDWDYFRGFPLPSRQMLCWISITMIHLTIIHKIHKSQNIKTENCKRILDTRWVSQSCSIPRRQTSATQGYKSRFNGMANVSVPEVNMLKI